MNDHYKSRASTHADDCWDWGHGHYECAVRKIKALRADLVESDEIREKLGRLLTHTAAALKGEPPAGVWHSWHDLPEQATQLVAALRKLEERVQRDEALLRQALDALDSDHSDIQLRTAIALRQHLGSNGSADTQS